MRHGCRTAELDDRLMPTPQPVKHGVTLFRRACQYKRCVVCIKSVLRHRCHVARAVDTLDIDAERDASSGCARYPTAAVRDTEADISACKQCGCLTGPLEQWDCLWCACQQPAQRQSQQCASDNELAPALRSHKPGTARPLGFTQPGRARGEQIVTDLIRIDQPDQQIRARRHDDGVVYFNLTKSALSATPLMIAPSWHSNSVLLERSTFL